MAMGNIARLCNKSPIDDDCLTTPNQLKRLQPILSTEKIKMITDGE